MIASGSPISAAKAAEMGLVDKLVDESHLAAEAIAFARTFDALRRTGDNSVSVDSAVFEAFATENARKIRGLEAPKACIEAVKADRTADRPGTAKGTRAVREARCRSAV